jgi:hydrogenase/urease accessory protein HupE
VTLRRAAVLASALALAPAPALAHGSLRIGEFWTGALQPVYHPESLMLALAVALWTAQRPAGHAVRVPAAFVAAALAGGALALLGHALPAAPWIVRAATLAVALAVAARLRLPPLPALALAVAAGLAHGSVAVGDEALARPVLYLLGLGTGTALLAFHVADLVRRHRAFWLEVGVRVAGSWIATVALLVAAFELRRGGG